MNRGARIAQKRTTTMNSSNETTSTTQAAAVAAQAAPAVPKKAAATRKPTAKKAAPKAKKAAKGAKKAAKPSVPREFSKKQIVLDLLRRKTGATMAEIMKATDWQAHSVRGFISGALGKKMGLKVESTRSESGERCYRIAAK
jgi:hypothetical protein